MVAATYKLELPAKLTFIHGLWVLRPCLRRLLGLANRLSSLLDGLQDLHVACASAQVAGKRFHPFITFRVWVPIQESFCGHQHAGRAIPALNCSLRQERFLKGVQSFALAQSFHGFHCCPSNWGRTSGTSPPVGRPPEWCRLRIHRSRSLPLVPFWPNWSRSTAIVQEQPHGSHSAFCASEKGFPFRIPEGKRRRVAGTPTLIPTFPTFTSRANFRALRPLSVIMHAEWPRSVFVDLSTRSLDRDFPHE